MDIAQLTAKILDRRTDPSAPLRIAQAGHPALRRRALTATGRLEPGLLEELVRAMTLTMREAPGVGLAAPQIGLPLRLFVMEDRIAPGRVEGTGDQDHAGDQDRAGDQRDAGDQGGAEDQDVDGGRLERVAVPLRTVLDPTYTVLGQDVVYAWEGCLSVDGWQSIVPRSRRVRLQGTELLEGGELLPVDEELVGWPARIVQHETDHLAGTLCHDVAVPRSFVEGGYTALYEDMAEATRRLGLEGPITQLAPGEVMVAGAMEWSPGEKR